MPIKPNVTSQLMNQTGLGRQGGAMSAGSRPKVMQDTTGAGFSAMENTLLKGPRPAAKALSGGGIGTQFMTQAAGGDIGGAPKLPRAFRQRVDPAAKAKVPNQNYFKQTNVYGKREK